MSNARYNAFDVAHWFIHKNEIIDSNAEGAGDLSLLKLLKLLYYSEGCSLALNKGSLFNEKILAWEYGPVIKEIWEKYKDNPYNLTLSDKERKDLSKISDEDNALLEEVFNVFGSYSAWALSMKTHSETPWLKATKNGTVFNKPLSRAVIKKFFQDNYIDLSC